MKRLSPKNTLLLIIDVQERLFNVMHSTLSPSLVANLERWGGAKEALGFHTLLTEQYPKGLGPTIPPVQTAFPGQAPIAKTCFDALESETVLERVLGLEPETVLVAGMEAHICVYQTVRALRARGMEVEVLSDAVASRSLENYRLGLSRIEALGARLTSTEMALMDMVGGSEHPAFKTVSKLIR